jgi:type VI secretion system secreted protein Hcp
MRRALTLLLIGALGVGGLTACMSDDGDDAREQRRQAALEEPGVPSRAEGGYQLVIDALDKQAIDVLSYNWGVTNPASVSSTGAASGKASFNDFRFTKKIDKVSPLLFKGAASGVHYPKATLTLYRSASGSPQKYMTYVLEDVLISAVEHGGNTADVPTEQVSLAYAKLTTIVDDVDPEGTRLGEVQYRFDLTTYKGG